MSSIQERLQLKRVPLDTWNVREQLCLASAVVRSGDQNWMSVSRALKTVGEPNRPSDWYSQKSCAAQYGALLEHVETPKRKKRSSEGAVETPQESIVKRLTQERIVEIQKNIAEMNQQYEQLKTEIIEVRNQTTSEERLREIWTGIESGKRVRERESARRAAWLKEREERRARVDRTWRPPVPTTPTSPVAPAPASPLLTSLLKSAPVVTTPQHMPHPASVVDTTSPSVNAPTLSLLLEKNTERVERENAAIEHIKSQLVQIEQQLKANSSPPAPSVDIDDIEIKAEDVYAFRDIDLHLPVTTLHKGARANDKPPAKEAPMVVDTVETQDIKEEQITVEEVEHEVTVDVEAESVEETLVEKVPIQEAPPAPAPPPAPVPAPAIPPVLAPAPVEVPIPFPDVKFPTPEIKVIQPPETKIKEEEIVEAVLEVTSESQPEPEVKDVVQEEVDKPVVVVEQEISEEPPVSSPQPDEQPITALVEQPVEVQADVAEVIDPDPQDIPLPPDPDNEQELSQPEPEAPPQLEPEVKEEMAAEVEGAEESNDVITAVDVTVEDLKKDEDSEDSIPLKQMLRGESQRHTDAPPEPLEPCTETDDDTPMEVSREEEKDGKKRRDYSRKKKPDSRTCSGSESAAEASAPESPSAGDADRQHRLWKKSVMLVYSRLCAHKYASLFTRPISDEEAPGYSCVVKRPIDLSAIRRNIDTGHTRSTAEFQRDVLLMLSNALLYNSSEHSVYTMAKEMHEEAVSQLSMLVAAQAHAGLHAPPRRKRRRYDEPNTTKRI